VVAVSSETVRWRRSDGKLVPHRLTAAAVAAGVTLEMEGPAIRCVSCGFMLYQEPRILGFKTDRFDPLEPLCRRTAASFGLLEEVEEETA
jgi:hypothetical protein